MKKQTFILLLATAGMFIFTSCEKSFECECEMKNGTTNVHEVISNSYSEAVKECQGTTAPDINSCHIINAGIYQY